MAPILSAGPISIKIPNICCAIYDITSNEVLMTQKLRKTKFFQWKNGCMTPKLLWGPFLIQKYNIEPLLAWAIKTTKVNTVWSFLEYLLVRLPRHLIVVGSQFDKILV